MLKEAENPSGRIKPGLIGIREGYFHSEMVFGRKGDNVARKLSQKDLADRAGLSSHRVGLFETLRDFPTPEEAEKIAAVLGKKRDELFPFELRFFIRGKNQPAQVRIQLTEREVARVIMETAQDMEEDRMVGASLYGQGSRTELGEFAEVVKTGLTLQEQKVLELRSESGETILGYSEIGSQMGLLEQQVRSIEHTAINKLVDAFAKEPYKDYIPGLSSILDRPETLIKDAQEALRIEDERRALDILKIAENRVLFPFKRSYRKRLFESALGDDTLENVEVARLRMILQIRQEAVDLVKNKQEPVRVKRSRSSRGKSAPIENQPSASL